MPRNVDESYDDDDGVLVRCYQVSSVLGCVGLHRGVWVGVLR